MNIMYLEIAGFYIAISFKMETDEENYVVLKKRLEDDMVFSLKNFFIEKPKKIDFTIEIVSSSSVDIKTDDDGNMYMKLYTVHKNKYIVPIQISQSQFRLIVMSVLHKLLAKNGGFVMHSSSALIEGKAYLFLGESGAGKSTTARLLSRNYPIAGDDSCIIKKEGKEYYFYSAPFIEKVFWIRRDKDRFPVGGFFFLKKSQLFKLDKIINKKTILDKVVNQLMVTDSIDNFIPHVFEFVSKFDSFYYLHFAKDGEKLVKLLKTIQ